MDTKPDVAKINDVEAWFESELPTEIEDAIWELNMAGIFVTYGFGTEALKRGRAASRLEPKNWRANFAIARAYALKGPDHDLNLAIEETSPVAATFRTSPDLLSDTQSLEVFSDQVLNPLGKWKSTKNCWTGFRKELRQFLTFSSFSRSKTRSLKFMNSCSV